MVDKLQEVQAALSKFGWEPLYVEKALDVDVKGVILTIFSTLVSTPEMQVFDAWVVASQDGLMNAINKSHFPSYRDAIAYHLGKMVTESNYALVVSKDGPASL